MRRITVEFLRRGPQHNQLLSPLTDYLAVCGDFPAGVVNVPWEHAQLQRLLDELRYDVTSAAPRDRAAGARDEAGARLAQMLGSITGLPGSMSGAGGATDEPTHLRIVMSASELAMLPFELSKTLVGSTSTGEGWLANQTDRLVCLTRHVRSVRSSVEGWSMQPRILFIAGPDVPFERHLDALRCVLDKWQLEPLLRDKLNDRIWRSDYLTAIERATLDEARTAATEAQFSHVHVLAHGAELDDGQSRFGIALADRVVRGKELAMALSTIGGKRGRLPSVVTLASCDSAAQGSVVTPGGSVAHELHSEGIDLVVASQFPISEDASVPFVEVFYQGQLNGDHPFVSICDVRRVLSTSFPDEHAWGSLAVYEALPNDFDVQLEQLRYWQTRRAHQKALTQFEALATSDQQRSENLATSDRAFDDSFRSPSLDEYTRLAAVVDAAREALPSDGAYGAESNGLRAAGFKRMAEVAYWLALAPDVTLERQQELFVECYRHLQSSLSLYNATMNVMLANSEEHVHRKATLHWIIGQVLVMQSVLGIEPSDELRGAARLTARLDLDNPDPTVRAWAFVSFVELTILQLTSGRGSSKSACNDAVGYANEIIKLMGFESEHARATRLQMRRYLTWWGDRHFVTALTEFGVTRQVPWDQEHGVLAAAEMVANALTPPTGHLLRPSPTPRRSTSDIPVAAQAATTATSDPKRRAAAAPRTGVFDVELLPANNGDCLWLTYGAGADDLHHVMFDCGSVAVAAAAAARIRSVPRVELFVLTHIDSDHISGAVPLFGDSEVSARFHDVWFNGWRQLRGFLSFAQGEEFSGLLDRDDRPFQWNRTDRADDPPPAIVTDGVDLPSVTLDGGLTLTVLSPTPDGLKRLARDWKTALLELNPPKAMLGRRARPSPVDAPESLDLVALAESGPTRDTSVPNLSSIAVLAEFGGRAVLFTGDAYADVLTASIRALQRSRGADGEPLHLDALKLSHHGSANATTKELLGVLDCDTYLVPTDGSIFYHPDRAAIARIIVHGGAKPRLLFNYRTDLNGLWDNAELQQRYGYSTQYPGDGTSGLTISF